jgi:hypothetical protein
VDIVYLSDDEDGNSLELTSVHRTR